MSSALVISASYDKQIRFWDAGSGRTVRCFTFQDSQVNSLLLLPGTNYLAVAGFGVLRLYDLATAQAAVGNSVSPVVGPMTSGGYASGTISGGSGGSTQPPPLYSSYENQASMNFTSLGAFPLSLQLEAGASLESSVLFAGGLASTAGGAPASPSGGTMSLTLVPGQNSKIGLVLYATSEDGHIRFFDPCSPATLRLLKDIPTGAAITCSAISPDRRFLLTGSQIGQVAVWHLPSIIASVSHDNQSMTNSHHQVTTAAEEPGTGTKEHVVKNDLFPHPHDENEVPNPNLHLFGCRPLQEIAFDNDYSAIRSIAIEPMARWAVVATNVGKLHFLRFAHDKKLGGSKVMSASALETSGVGNGSPLVADGDEGLYVSTSCPPLTSVADDESSRADRAVMGHCDSIYRSAVANSDRFLGLRGNMGTFGSMSGHPIKGATSSGSVPSGSRRSTNIFRGIEDADGEKVPVTPINLAGGVDLPMIHTSVSSAPVSPTKQHTELERELELEVFHSFQAHYKYILKTAISPNGELLVTCSADYTIGRYIVPPQLRVCPTGTISQQSGSAREEDNKMLYRSNLAPQSGGNASLASTQAPADLRPAIASAQADERNATAAGRGVSANLSNTTEEGCESSDSVLATSHPSAAASVSHADGLGATPPGASGAAIGLHLNAKDISPSFPSLTDGLSSKALGQVSGSLGNVYFTPLKPLCGHNRWVWDGVFSDCCRFFFSASSDNNVRMWNGLQSDKPQSTSFVGHTKPVVALVLYYEKRKVPVL